MSAVVNAVYPGAITDEAKVQIRWLFKLRNETVHYRADWHAIELHPVLELPTTRVARTYSSEVASRGVEVDVGAHAVQGEELAGRVASGTSCAVGGDVHDSENDALGEQVEA